MHFLLNLLCQLLSRYAQFFTLVFRCFKSSKTLNKKTSCWIIVSREYLSNMCSKSAHIYFPNWIRHADLSVIYICESLSCFSKRCCMHLLWCIPSTRLRLVQLLISMYSSFLLRPCRSLLLRSILVQILICVWWDIFFNVINHREGNETSNIICLIITYNQTWKILNTKSIS